MNSGKRSPRAAGVDLDAPTVVLSPPVSVHGHRQVRAGRSALIVGGAFALGAGIAAVVVTHASDANVATLQASPTNQFANTPIGVPAPGGVNLGIIGDVGMTNTTNDTGTSEVPSASTGGLPVPGGIEGLTTDEAMDRYRDAGFANVRFINSASDTVLVPNSLFRVTSAPVTGQLADPDVSLVVWAEKVPYVVSPEERAASDRASEAYDRKRQAEMDCGLYTLEGPWSSEVAECIERRTS